MSSRKRNGVASARIQLISPACSSFRERNAPSCLEPLERRCLLSVSATTLLGPSLTTGTEYVYENYANGSPAQLAGGDTNETVIGPATFNGMSAIETNTVVPGLFPESIQSYSQLVAGALVQYGSTQTGSGIEGVSPPTVDTPPYISLPATLTEGVPYTTSYTATTSQAGVPAGSTYSSGLDGMYSYSVELASDATQSITVPAGTFNAFEVDTKVDSDYAAGSFGSLYPSLETDTRDFYAIGVGLVESISTTNLLAIPEVASGGSVTVSGAPNTFGSTVTTLELTNYGTPARLVFTSTPSYMSVLGNGGFTVDVVDANGNLVTTDYSTITLSLNQINGAVLSAGETSVRATAGVATFDIGIATPGVYTLTAAEGSLQSAVSAPFTVSPNLATGMDGHWVVNGTAGNDIISLNASGNDVIVAVNGQSETLFGAVNDPAIIINGEAGDDTVTIGADMPGVSVQGGPGNDTIIGGPGNDTLGGGQGNDLILGEGGDDMLRGGMGDSTLHGGAGNDTLIAGQGDNVLAGGAGDDTINAFNGMADTIYGGAGNDTAYVDQGLDQIPNNDVETVIPEVLVKAQ
jgi:Ca2+-binding RTX toxin-like protein